MDTLPTPGWCPQPQTQRHPFRKDALDRTGILNEAWISGSLGKTLECFCRFCTKLHLCVTSTRKRIVNGGHTWAVQIIPVQHSRAQGVLGQCSGAHVWFWEILCRSWTQQSSWIPPSLGCCVIPCCCTQSCKNTSRYSTSQIPPHSEHLSSPEMCL